MKLYYNPKSRAAIIRWMLDECGADYELVPIDFEKREHKTPEFLRINPAGKLPALVDGEVTLFETVAICLYLAEKFPQAGLVPARGTAAYGRYLTMMVYATSQLEPSLSDFLMGVETPAYRGWTGYETAKTVVETELGDGPWLCGEQFTAADVMIGAMFLWSRMWGKTTGRPRLEAYADRLAQRPAAMKMQN